MEDIKKRLKEDYRLKNTNKQYTKNREKLALNMDVVNIKKPAVYFPKKREWMVKEIIDITSKKNEFGTFDCDILFTFKNFEEVKFRYYISTYKSFFDKEEPERNKGIGFDDRDGLLKPTQEKALREKVKDDWFIHSTLKQLKGKIMSNQNTN